MSLWMVKESPKKDGYYLTRERQDKNTNTVRIDNGDVYYKRREDAERACDIRNNTIVELNEKRRKEKYHYAK